MTEDGINFHENQLVLTNKKIKQKKVFFSVLLICFIDGMSALRCWKCSERLNVCANIL